MLAFDRAKMVLVPQGTRTMYLAVKRGCYYFFAVLVAVGDGATRQPLAMLRAPVSARIELKSGLRDFMAGAY